MSIKRVLLAFTTASVLAFVQVRAGEKVTLEKPVSVTGKKLDKSKFGGRVVSYDDAGFEIKIKADETEAVAWKDLDARTQFVVRNSLIPPKDAAAHLELGRDLLGVEGGKEWADKAFAIAVRLDASLKDKVAEIKKDAAEEGKKPASAKKDGGESGGKPEVMANEERMGPKVVGDIQKQFWGPQTPDQQAAALEELKKFAEETKKKVNSNLVLYETKFFLFYSDLPTQEAKNWSGLLDRMYVKLAEMFAIDPKQNIWRGKAIVFVFKNKGDYPRFETVMHQTDSGGSDGMCHQFGDGAVHIAFYRQKDELLFAHVLVHESVHGFIHRYRTPTPVPNWANEGLAEWIARQLLVDKQPNEAKKVRYYAQYFMRQYGGVADLFEVQHIQGWQYPVAEMLTSFMIEQNRKGYVAFINAVKDGMPWEEALETKYKAPRDKLLPAFGQAMKVKIDG
jgi:hypothetical protein